LEEFTLTEMNFPNCYGNSAQPNTQLYPRQIMKTREGIPEEDVEMMLEGNQTPRGPFGSIADTEQLELIPDISKTVLNYSHHLIDF
jgi:hypothetical protein